MISAVLSKVFFLCYTGNSKDRKPNKFKGRFYMKRLFIKSCISLLICSIPVLTNAAVINGMQDSNMTPTGKGWGVRSTQPVAKTSNPAVPQNGIFYHGGPVMGTTTSTLPNVYFIWYGNWSGNTGVSILTNLAKNIGASPYYNINSTYVDNNNQPVKRVVNFPVAGVFDNYSQGTNLTDNAVFQIVSSAITSNKLPLDRNGIYFVLTSADVNETSGFCTQYCGWHTFGTIQNTNIKYSFVGNAARCPNACAAQRTSPNNNVGADAMASVVAHELEETVTDPNLNAWFDNSGEENADKCAWTFGATKVAPNGSRYNVTLGGLNYLIQQNWLNANGGLCAISN